MNDIKTLILKYVCYTLVLLLVSYLFESFNFGSSFLGSTFNIVLSGLLSSGPSSFFFLLFPLNLL